MQFATESLASLTLTMRPDVIDWLPAVFTGATTNWQEEAVRRLRGGRGEVVVVRAATTDVLVRPYRRGGLPGRLLRDVYFGWQPRPSMELEVTETLRARGAPVVEAFGTAVQWLAPGCYRGWIASRYLDDTHTLWQWAQERRSGGARGATLAAAGEAIGSLHAHGGFHRDLNLNNLLVPTGTAPMRVTIIDLDRARLQTKPSNLDTMLQRFRRSARKLDPTGTVVDEQDLQVVEHAARSAGAASRAA